MIEIVHECEDQTDLYRYFDKEGALLYIGVSLNAVARAAQHRQQSGWFGDFHTMTRETFATRSDALQAETIAIQQENPKHNIRKLSKSTPKSRVQKEYELMEWAVVYKPMYNTDEAAKALGVSTSRVRSWVKEGRLGSVRLGSRTMITGWQIIDFLEWAQKHLGGNTV